MINTNTDFRTLIHTPQDCALEFIDHHATTMTQNGITLGLPRIDEHMIPLKPGDVVGIIARPGHGKSTFMAYLAQKVARDLYRDKRADEYACYVTYEQSTEEIESYFQLPDDSRYDLTDIARGRVDLDILKVQSTQRPLLPVWIVGRSLTRRKVTPRMTFSEVIKSIEYIEKEWGKKPAIIALDYIQIIPIEKAGERVEQVTEAIMQTKELAMRFACPVTVGVQARREVDDRKLKIPGANDCQWASAIEQVADKLFGFYRPILTEREGDTIGSYNGQPIAVTKTLMIARLLKQRFGPAGQTFHLYFAPELLRLADLELTHVDING